MPHPTRLLLIALGAMSLQQVFATIGRGLPPILAPAVVFDLSLDPAWLGVYVAIGAVASLAFQLGCGSFILRHGALRISQAALCFVAAGLALSTAGPLGFWALAAIIGAGGSAMSTPASSHLLARYTEARLMPLVFAVKQTAVPVALLLAGLLGPLMTGLWGWRGAMLATAGACFLFVLLLEPLRREFDADRRPGYPVRLGDFATVLAAVLRGHNLRTLALACFAFNGLQTVFTSYFVITLTSLGYGLAGAGAMYSLAMVVAVPGRILWGWIGSGHIAPRLLMAWLSLGMAAGAAALGMIGPDWPVWLTGLVAVALSATVMSWHGVVLSECVRLAPPGMPGAATGGVLSFGQLGGLLLPLAYAGMLAATGLHGIGFLVCGLPGLVVGLMLLRKLGGGAMRVGFMGPGLMGHGAAKHILLKGFPLTVLGHRNRAPVDDLLARGAAEAADLAALAAASDVIVLFLPGAAEVEATVTALLPLVRPGLVVLDASTGQPETTRRLGALLAARGAAMVDGPVGRTPKEAEEGRLSSMLGGDPEVIARIRPIVECYADTVIPCGALGAALTVKLVNNFVSFSNAVIIGESFAAASKLGVDLAALAAVIEAGGSNSVMFSWIAPWIRTGDDSRGRGRLWMGQNVLETYRAIAKAAGAASEMADAVSRVIAGVVAAGHGERFLPSLPGILAQIANAPFRNLDGSDIAKEG